MNLYITKPGQLRRKDNTLIFEFFENDQNNGVKINHEHVLEEDMAVSNKHTLPVETIDSIYLFSEVRINTKLLNFLAQKRIPVHVFNYYGYYSGTYMPKMVQISGDLVIRQGQAFLDDQKRLAICFALVEAKIHNMMSVIHYYKRRSENKFTHQYDQISELKSQLQKLNTPEELMGIEGQATRVYYSLWHHWLGETAKNFQRKYNPPDNPLNALVSFLNSLLYTALLSELYRTALYPGISYLHSPQTRRFSLALDLVEPFKPLMVDRLIFRLFGQKEIGTNDFRSECNGILLK